MVHHVYLAPGMFGFGRLATYDYFAHVERALGARFRAAGETLEAHVVDVLPTASMRRRAARLAELIQETSGGGGAIHRRGHSTGGIDVRLVASPAAELPVSAEAVRWLPRLRSVTMMNTPHYGTPLASFFATSKGQRILYALSAFTFIGLSMGGPSIAAAGLLIALVGRSDRAIGIELRVMDRSVDSLLRLVDDARSPDVRAYLEAIKDDQGAVLQLSPESMDLMVAGFADRPGVAYQSTASMAPTPSPRSWIRALGHPWQTISLTLFTTLHAITSRCATGYPCAAVRIAAPPDEAAWAGDATEALLARTFGAVPELSANDGVVPLRSQLWGTLVWAGLGDHLDVLGHFLDDRVDEPVESRHHDWLTSGSAFRRPHFEALMDAIAGGMLKAAATRRGGLRATTH